MNKLELCVTICIKIKRAEWKKDKLQKEMYCMVQEMHCMVPFV